MVTAAAQVAPGDPLEVRLSDGRLEVEVRKVEPGTGSGWLAWTNTDAANANDKCTANKPAWW